MVRFRELVQRSETMRRTLADSLSPPSPSDDWLTTVEVAELLRVHPKHVYRLLHQGMPARRVGGQWRFSRDAIKRWAETRGEGLRESEAESSQASAPGMTLLSAELVDVSELTLQALAKVSGVKFATVLANGLACRQMLDSGEVAVAILRCSNLPKPTCATVRISLGNRSLGILRGAKSQAWTSLVVPSGLDEAARSVLLAHSDLVVTRVDSELEAVSVLVRGEADAALASEVWAARLGFAFERVMLEPWELAVRVDAMEDPSVSLLCVAAQSDLMRELLSRELVDARECGGQMRFESSCASSPAPAASDEAQSPGRPARTRRTVRWTILTRDTPEQMLHLVDALRKRGLRVGGFVQVPSGPMSAKPLGYDLYRISRSERVPLAERIRHDLRAPTGARYCELTFHSEAIARASEWLREDIADSDLLVVDGIGRLEERGQGLFPALAWARMQTQPKMFLVSSRSEHVPLVLSRLALSQRLVSELDYGHGVSVPTHVLDHILQSCGKARARRPLPGAAG